MPATAELALSVVVPVFNEHEVIRITMDRLRQVLERLDITYEVVVVDDGSIDNSVAILTGLRQEWPQLRLIRLRRNSGHQAALLAGLLRAGGAYVVSIDADLQDPPELIERMLNVAHAEGVDVVYAVRARRASDTLWKRWTADLYYRLMGHLAASPVPRHVGDYRMLSRRTIELIRQLPERAPVLRLIIPWLGLPNAVVEYERQPRAAGRTKYSVAKMTLLALDSVTAFSAAPLRLATWLGVGGIGLCAVLALIAFGAYLSDITVPGWTSLYVAVLFLAAVQLLCLGLMGEYVGRTFTVLLGRPAYLIESDSDDEN